MITEYTNETYCFIIYNVELSMISKVVVEKKLILNFVLLDLITILFSMQVCVVLACLIAVVVAQGPPPRRGPPPPGGRRPGFGPPPPGGGRPGIKCII